MKKHYLIIIILLLLTAVVLTQLGFDKQSKAFKASAAYQPLVASSDTLKKLNLGLQAALSDYFWLQAIQYYGGDRADHNYQKLADYLDLATELDPKFSYPYAFAALILPSEKIDQGYAIARKGIDRRIPDWQIAYYLAASYHIYKHDKPEAAKYFDLAARTPGAPSELQTVSAAYSAKPNARQTARAIWQAIYDSSSDELTRGRAKNYLYFYQLLDLFDQSSTVYKQKNGQWPKQLNDLVNADILRSVPENPFGLSLTFDADGRVVIE